MFGLELTDNDVNNLIIEKLSEAPSNPSEGQLYYNTSTDILYVYTGSAWEPVNENSYGSLEDLMTLLKVGGFVDETKVSISLSGPDKDTLDITPADANGYEYILNGKIVNIKTNKSVTLSGSPHSNGIHYVYFNDTQGTLTTSQVFWDLFGTVPVAMVFWYQGNVLGQRSLLAPELHNTSLPKAVHKIMHLNEGAKKNSGGIISGFSLNASTDSGVTFGVSATAINDEDIFMVLAALVDGNGSGANYTVFYHTDANTMAFSQGNNVPYLFAASNRIYYNPPASGLVQATNAYFVNYYLWATNFQGEARFCLIPGQAQYSSTTTAYAETLESMSLSYFPTKEAVCIGQLTFETQNSYNNSGKCRLRRVQPLNISLVSVASASNTMTASLVSLNTATFDGLLDSTVVDVQKLAETVDDFHTPHTAYNPTLSWTTGTPEGNVSTVFRYSVTGKRVFFDFYYSADDGNGATDLNITLPIAPKNNSNLISFSSMQVVGSTKYSPYAYINSSESLIRFYLLNTCVDGSALKLIANGSYEIE